MNIIAMITAREGSQRLKVKNLALINGKPMVYYAIQAAKDAGIFSRIVLNSDSIIFKDIAERYGVEFYHRPNHLGGSDIKIDDVIMDFIENNECDVVAIVNTPSPLQTGEEVKQGINYFIDNNFDSMISVKEQFVHTVIDNCPVNFNENEALSRTQDLKPVETLIYSLMVWRSSEFKSEYKKNGYAFFCGKTGYFRGSKNSSFLVKTEEDLKLIDRIMRSEEKELEYDPLIERF